MRQSIILFYFVIILVPACASALWAETTYIWCDEESGGRHAAASQAPAEGLRLYRSSFPNAGREMDTMKMEALNGSGIWIKNPEGGISTASLSAENGGVVLDFPSGSGRAGVEGIHIVGMHIRGDEIDSKTGEHVHYYSKYLMDSRTETSPQDHAPEVFFNDPDKMALEIGPFYEPDEELSSRGAGALETCKKQRFRILYGGRPLGGASVTIITDGEWERRETTDPKGVFSILPVENGKGDGRILCAVSHRDPSTGEYHVSTLVMHVFTPVSEWKDRFLTFAFYAFGAVCLSVFFVLYRINRRKKRDIKIMLEFERRKIREA